MTFFFEDIPQVALFYGYAAHHSTPINMSKRGTSFFYLPRRKEGEDPNGPPRHIRVSYEVLEGLFHLKLKDAAREIGLCDTTFKKACRRFNIERWPAAIPTLRRAVTVSCTSPVSLRRGVVFDGGSSSLGFPFSSIAASSSNVGASSERRRDLLNPFGAAFSSAAPQGLPQQASIALDTRSYGEARHAGPAFQLNTFAPVDAPSYIDTLTGGRLSTGMPLPIPEGLPTTRPCGGEQRGATPLEAGPPGQRSCVEAVMEYLDLEFPISEADVESMLSNDD